MDVLKDLVTLVGSHSVEILSENVIIIDKNISKE